MSRYLSTLVLVFILPASLAAAPNIIVILADDLGYECVGAYGGVSYQTPSIDDLARRGMMFGRAYAQPLCTPSRLQIMTGKYNARNYVRFQYLPPGETTFANLLKQRGYRTCMAGKWQLGNDRVAFDAGFDEYCLWDTPIGPSRYHNPTVSMNGVRKYFPGGYGPDVMNDFALDFMQRNKSRPFFLYYSMLLPHYPHQLTPDSPNYPSAPDVNNPAHFPGMVRYMDRMVGNVVQKINQLGLRQLTLILFVGDNGTDQAITSLLDTGKSIHGRKGWTVDAGIHVPLIASWPSFIPERSFNNDLVDLTDFLPTILEATGGSIPGGIDGQSILPKLFGLPDPAKPWVYFWYLNPMQNELYKFALHDEGYKLYATGKFYGPGDPAEHSPLTNLTNHQRNVRNELQSVLDYYDDIRNGGGGGGGGGSGNDTTDDLTGVITTRGELPGRSCLCAFDNTSSTKWVDLRPNASTPSWIQYKYAGGETFTIDSYTLTSGDDVPGRDPRDWELRGSNNGGATWTVVDGRQGQTFSGRKQMRTFNVSSPGAYNVYRLHIQRASDANQVKVQLSEIELLGEASGGGGGGGGGGVGDTTDDRTGAVTTRGELYGRFGRFAFDNDTITKWVDLRPSVSTPSWIQYQYAGGQRFVIDSYTLTSGDDVPGRDPRDWQLQGSNNGGATWTVVDSRQNQSFASRRQLRSFVVNSPGAFNIYRLFVQSVAGASEVKVQLSEIELIGAAGGS